MGGAPSAAVSELLVWSGTAGLAWRRQRGSGEESWPFLRQWHDAYRLATLRSAVYEGDLRQDVAALRSAGIEPILAKGWAVAAFYPERGLRPYGDLDFYVPVEDDSHARQVLEGRSDRRTQVDVHAGFRAVPDRDVEGLYRRSTLLSAGTESIRVFGTEDHLRLLCLHMLGHGAWRALWLCDLAAVVEHEAGLDWDLVLTGDRRRSVWIAYALRLSAELLGADLSRAPATVRDARLPSWLVPSVMRQWGARNFVPHGRRLPLSGALRDPRRWAGELRQRWPNPIEATVGIHGPFNELPRLPFQLAECLKRTARFAFRMPLISRERAADHGVAAPDGTAHPA